MSTRWQRRIIFVAGGIAIGAAAVGLAQASDWAQLMFAHVLERWHYASFLITPLGFALSVFLTIRFFPNSQGSGIPQAIAARELESRVPLNRPLDVLVQHLVTVALGSGFREAAMLAEVRSSYAYRNLTDTEIPEPVDLIVCDASFIGLAKVLDRPIAFASPGARMVALINKVETLADRAPAHETAERLLREPAIHSVVLATLRGDEPALEVCTR